MSLLDIYIVFSELAALDSAVPLGLFGGFIPSRICHTICNYLFSSGGIGVKFGNWIGKSRNFMTKGFNGHLF